MAITDDSITTSIYTEIRSKLVTALTGTGISVLGQYNDTAFQKPIVVLTPALISETYNKFGTEGKKEITVVIDIYAPRSLECDENEELIRNELKKNDIEGISLQDIETSYDFSQSQSDKLHVKTLSCNYVRE